MKKEKYMKINATKFGLAGGVISGIGILVMTLFASYFPGWSNLMLEAYGRFGYSLNGIGIFLGLVYGFIDGFIGFWLLAIIYNKLLK